MAVAVSLVNHEDVMLTPGPNTSTQVPKLENDARRSLMSVAPSVIASGTRAGEKLHAFRLLLPAAIAYVTPDAIELATAVSSAAWMPPPRLMFATAGLMPLPVTQSTPATTCAVVPLPAQLSTRTATSAAPLATPNALPPVVPATCVPWPWQSSAVPPSIASKPLVARPPKSVWVNRMPVSRMYACTFDAVVGNVYELSSGRFRWSMRSNPHDGGLGCTSVMDSVWFCCTKSTDGWAASRWASASRIETSKPRSAELYTRATCPPCEAARLFAVSATADRPTEAFLNTTM